MRNAKKNWKICSIISHIQFSRIMNILDFFLYFRSNIYMYQVRVNVRKLYLKLSASIAVQEKEGEGVEHCDYTAPIQGNLKQPAKNHFCEFIFEKCAPFDWRA